MPVNSLLSQEDNRITMASPFHDDPFDMELVDATGDAVAVEAVPQPVAPLLLQGHDEGEAAPAGGEGSALEAQQRKRQRDDDDAEEVSNAVPRLETDDGAAIATSSVRLDDTHPNGSSHVTTVDNDDEGEPDRPVFDAGSEALLEGSNDLLESNPADATATVDVDPPTQIELALESITEQQRQETVDSLTKRVALLEAALEEERCRQQSEKLKWTLDETLRSIISNPPPVPVVSSGDAAVDEKLMVELACAQEEARLALVATEKERSVTASLVSELEMTSHERDTLLRQVEVLEKALKSAAGSATLTSGATTFLENLQQQQQQQPTTVSFPMTREATHTIVAAMKRAAEWIATQESLIQSTWRQSTEVSGEVKPAADDATDTTTEANGDKSDEPSDQPLVVSSPFSPLKDIAVLLNVCREHMVDLSERHDACAERLGSQEASMRMALGRMSALAMSDLEPRAALLREVADRNTAVLAPSYSEKRALERAKELESRVLTLEAALQTYLLKGDGKGVEPASVVPQVLVQTQQRCAALEKQLESAKAELSVFARAVHRSLGGSQSITWRRADDDCAAASREALLERCSRRWMKLSSDCVAQLAAQSSKMCRWNTSASPLLEAQLLHLNSHIAALSTMLQGVLAENESLRQLSIAQGRETTLLRHTLAYSAVGNDSMITDIEGNVTVDSQPDGASTVIAAFNDAVQAMAQQASELSAKIDASFRERELIHLQRIEYLCAALQCAERAIGEAQDVYEPSGHMVELSHERIALPALGPRKVAGVTLVNSSIVAEVRKVASENSLQYTKRIEEMSKAFAEKVNMMQSRIDWILQQDGQEAVKKLEVAEKACAAAKMVADEDKARLAAVSAETNRLKTRMQDYQNKISQLEAVSSSSAELMSKATEREAALKKQIERLEASLTTARDAHEVETKGHHAGLEAMSAQHRVELRRIILERDGLQQQVEQLQSELQAAVAEDDDAVEECVDEDGSTKPTEGQAEDALLPEAAPSNLDSFTEEGGYVMNDEGASALPREDESDTPVAPWSSWTAEGGEGTLLTATEENEGETGRWGGSGDSEALGAAETEETS